MLLLSASGDLRNAYIFGSLTRLQLEVKLEGTPRMKNGGRANALPPFPIIK